MKPPHPLRTLALLTSLTLSGCVAIETLAPPVSFAMAGGADTSTLEAGRRLYVGRCAACHSVDPVGSHSSARWREIIEDMAGRTKLTPAEHDAVLAYVLAARRVTPPRG